MYSAVNTFEWCVLHIFFVWHKLKKNLPQNFSIFKLFFAAAVKTWLKPSPGVEFEIVEGIYPLHTITHTPSTHNHSRMAFTSAPRRALPLVEKAVWHHLNWHYVPLTLSTVTYRSSWLGHSTPGVTMTKRRLLTRYILIGFWFKSLWLTLLVKSYQCVSLKSFSLSWQSDGLYMQLIILSPHDP